MQQTGRKDRVADAVASGGIADRSRFSYWNVLVPLDPREIECQSRCLTPLLAHYERACETSFEIIDFICGDDRMLDRYASKSAGVWNDSHTPVVVLTSTG